MSLLCTVDVPPDGSNRATIPTPHEALLDDVKNLRGGLVLLREQIVPMLIAEIDRIEEQIKLQESTRSAVLSP